MKITYLGHSCFKLEKDAFAMIIDPYKAGSVPGYAPLKEHANQVVSSHKHDDHFGLKEVKLAVTRADTPFMVSFIETFHDDKEGALRGFNNVIIIDVPSENLKIVHLGDLGCRLSDEDIGRIKDCDILMIPVGGYYTIDAKAACELVNEVEPKIAIPMHYRGDGFGYEKIGTVDEFIKLAGPAEESDGELVLEGPQEGRRIIVMKGKKINV